MSPTHMLHMRSTMYDHAPIAMRAQTVRPLPAIYIHMPVWHAQLAAAAVQVSCPNMRYARHACTIHNILDAGVQSSTTRSTNVHTKSTSLPCQPPESQKEPLSNPQDIPSPASLQMVAAGTKDAIYHSGRNTVLIS
jgi:histone deacetylase complex regulatory component SIN3